MTGGLVCPECGEANPARAKFCLECGARLELGAGERRLVSVLFADLSGFTAYSEKTDIEDVRAVAEEAAGALSRIVRRYGGVVDKVIGDAVMAVFGAPVTNEDDAERAVRAALEMQSYVRDNHTRFAGLSVTIGINTGEAMYGPLGPGGRYTVVGDTVNTAARLQSAAQQGEILIGQPTYLSVRHVIEAEEMEPIVAKNKAEPVPAYRPLGRTEGRVHRADLVGRGEEIARLTELWERARSDLVPHIALIVAEPGTGKSRLTDEIAQRLEASADTYRGRCLSFGEGITYWPVVEMLRDMAGITLEDSTDETATKLGSLLETVGSEDLDELRTMASALASLVGVPRTPRGTFEVSEITRAELHWGVRRLLELLAAQRPLLLIFEDLHWGEEALIEFVEFLGTGEGPVLALATARPGLEEKAPGLFAPSKRRRTIHLAPLGVEEAGEMIRGLLGDAAITDEEIAILGKAAEGNPLYLEEIAGMVSEARSRGETFDPSGSGGIPLGNRLRVMVEARIDALPQPEARILQQAAVFGASFGPEELGEITGGDGEIPGLLDALEGRDLIRAAEVREAGSSGRYDFKHELVREAAYERLPKAERSRIHERCGRWFLSRPGGEDSYVEIAASHLERSCLLARELGQVRMDTPVIDAVRTLVRAAERAQGREGMSESDSFYGRALGLADPGLPESTAEIRVGRAVTGLALGQRDRVAAELAGASEQAAALGRPDLRGRALLRLASLDRGQGRAAQALEKIREAASIAGAIEDADLEARATIQEAVFLSDVQGETEVAIEELRRVVDACHRVGDRALEVQARYFLGVCLYNSGDLEGAETELVPCVELAGQLGSMRDEARASHLLALAKFYRGDLDEVERLSGRALAWVERTTDNYLRLQTLVLLAKMALVNGDPEGAVRSLEEALPIARQRGAWHIADVSRYLAQALAETGDAAAASRVAAEALEHCTEEDAYIQAAVAMAEAAAAGASGDAERAMGKFGAALAMLEKQALWLDLAEARLAYAEMLTRLGRMEESELQTVAGRKLAAQLGAGILAGAIEATPGMLAGAAEAAPA